MMVKFNIQQLSIPWNLRVVGEHLGFKPWISPNIFPYNVLDKTTWILQDAYERFLFVYVGCTEPPTERRNFARWNGVIGVEEGTGSNVSTGSMLVRSYLLVIKHGNGKYHIYVFFHEHPKNRICSLAMCDYQRVDSASLLRRVQLVAPLVAKCGCQDQEELSPDEKAAAREPSSQWGRQTSDLVLGNAMIIPTQSRETAAVAAGVCRSLVLKEVYTENSQTVLNLCRSQAKPCLLIRDLNRHQWLCVEMGSIRPEWPYFLG